MDKVPTGVLRGTFEQLFVAGCIQTGADIRGSVDEAVDGGHIELFSGLHQLTKGNICQGCPIYQKGTCSAFRKYHTAGSEETPDTGEGKERMREATTALGTTKYPGMSVKQIAEKLGISKNEVRRRKMKGEL